MFVNYLIYFTVYFLARFFDNQQKNNPLFADVTSLFPTQHVAYSVENSIK
jgi:hypothetical protein